MMDSELSAAAHRGTRCARGVLRPLIAFLVAAIGLWLSIRGVQFDQLVQSVRAADLRWLALAPLAIGVSISARVERWRLLLGTVALGHRAALFWAVLLGYFGSTFLPFRLGEGVRIYAAKRLGHVPYANSVASIFAEHVLDIGALALGLVLVLGYVPPDRTLRGLASTSTGAFLLFCTGLVATVIMRGSLRRGLVRLRSARRWRVWTDRVFNAADRVAASLDSLSSSRIAAAAAWSVVAWVLTAGFHLVVAVSLDLPNPALSAILTMAATNLAALLPASPGYIGVFEYATVVALLVLGVSKPLALGYAIATHSLLLISFIVGGLVSLSVTGMNWKGVGKDGTVVP